MNEGMRSLHYTVTDDQYVLGREAGRDLVIADILKVLREMECPPATCALNRIKQALQDIIKRYEDPL